MTSKEALNRLYNHLKAILEEDAPELIRIIKSYYDIVAKDLEVLEILKRIKWDVYENGGGNEWYWFIDTNQSMKITEEEANKVKEWLDEI